MDAEAAASDLAVLEGVRRRIALRIAEDGGNVLRLCCEHVVAHLAVAEEPRCQVRRRCSGISASLSPFSRLSRNLR